MLLQFDIIRLSPCIIELIERRSNENKIMQSTTGMSLVTMVFKKGNNDSLNSSIRSMRQ